MFAELVEEWDRDLTGGDPLVFPGYADGLERTDHEAVRTGRADGVVLIEGDFDVVGGSMGLVHGEKVVRAFDRAVELRLPVVVVTRSGGLGVMRQFVGGGSTSVAELLLSVAPARVRAAPGTIPRA